MGRERVMARHWFVVKLIHEREGGTNISQLQRSLKEAGFAVCRRTLERDLACLERMGFVAKDRAASGSAVWRAGGTSVHTVPVPVAPSQMVALALAREAMVLGTPWVANVLDDLLRKLAPASSPQLNRVAEWIEQRLYVQKPVARARQQRGDIWEKIFQAIRETRKILVSYRKSDGSLSRNRVLAPLCLFMTRENVIYLAAYCELRKGERVFRLSRFQSVKILPEKYPEVLRQGVEKYERDSIGAFYAKPHRILIEIAEHLVGYFKENPLHVSQKIVTREGIHCLELDVGINETLVHELLGFGPSVRVVEPRALGELLAARHKEAAEYQTSLFQESSQERLPLCFED